MLSIVIRPSATAMPPISAEPRSTLDTVSR
jgi:hypothetical protein